MCVASVAHPNQISNQTQSLLIDTKPSNCYTLIASNCTASQLNYFVLSFIMNSYTCILMLGTLHKPSANHICSATCSNAIRFHLFDLDNDEIHTNTCTPHIQFHWTCYFTPVKYLFISIFKQI